MSRAMYGALKPHLKTGRDKLSTKPTPLLKGVNLG